MQTVASSVDNTPNTIIVTDTSNATEIINEDIIDMEKLPTILLSTSLTNAENSNSNSNTAATTNVLLRQCLENNFDCEFKQHSNVEAMSVTPSPQGSPAKKKRHRTNTCYSLANNNNNNSNNNNTSKSSSSSMSEISVINGVANTINNGRVVIRSTIMENGDNTFSRCDEKKLQIPPKTLSIIAYGEQYYADLSDSANSEASTSVAPSTTPSLDNSHTSSTISTPNTDKQLVCKYVDGSEDLLQWKDMPQYLQFNPYVLKGYRPLQSFRGCLFSMFAWHNETINILTHALPIVYILATVPGLMPWEREFRFLSFCHLIGAIAPWCGSFVYHLFMNIDSGESIYYRLLKLDMVGIWVSQSFGALPLVTATTFCLSYNWRWALIISYCILSLWGLYKALTATSPWERRLCFALPFCMRSILTVMRTFGLVGGTRVALSHVYLQDGVSILGGAIGAMRIPEKWFPGLVDYYLNSHNIMHVLVVVAVYSMHKATLKDFEWMSVTSCEEFNNTTTESIVSAIKAHMEL